LPPIRILDRTLRPKPETLKPTTFHRQPPTLNVNPQSHRCICNPLPPIRILDLANNGLGKEGAEMLAQALRAEGSTVPEVVNLSDNNLGPEGIRVLSAALGHRLRPSGGAVVMVKPGVQFTELVELDILTSYLSPKP
jgi:hypothetical protein